MAVAARAGLANVLASELFTRPAEISPFGSGGSSARRNGVREVPHPAFWAVCTLDEVRSRARAAVEVGPEPVRIGTPRVGLAAAPGRPTRRAHGGCLLSGWPG